MTKKQSDKLATSPSGKSGKKKTVASVTKSSSKRSTKPTSTVKAKGKTSKRDSIYSLDTWKWNYEDVTKPKNKVVVSLKKRIQHAWEVLKG